MNRIAIGSANFGMEYGFKNSKGKLTQNIVNKILNTAYKNNIHIIDTAQAYGESKQVIGNFLKQNKEKKFKIVTKITGSNNVIDCLDESFKRFETDKLYGILFHNFKYYKDNPKSYDILNEYKKNHRCEKIGFSLYYPEELEFLLDNNVEFDLIQIAYSLFDQRFEKYFPLLHERNIEIHVRSAFLQGLFFINPDRLGEYFDKVKKKLLLIHKLSKETGLSIASICINFALLNPNVDKVVIGVDSLNNLKENVNVLKDYEIVKKHIKFLRTLNINDTNILFPHFWKLK